MMPPRSPDSNDAAPVTDLGGWQMIKMLKDELETARSQKSKAENSASIMQSKADGARLAGCVPCFDSVGQV